MGLGKIPMFFFDEVFARLQAVTNARSQLELSRILGVSQSSISNAKSRQFIPDTWLVKLLISYKVNPHWLLTGTGPAYLSESSNQISEEISGELNDEPVVELNTPTDNNGACNSSAVLESEIPETTVDLQPEPVFKFMKPVEPGYYWYKPSGPEGSSEEDLKPVILYHPTPRTMNLRGLFYGPLKSPKIPEPE